MCQIIETQKANHCISWELWSYYFCSLGVDIMSVDILKKSRPLPPNTRFPMYVLSQKSVQSLVFKRKQMWNWCFFARPVNVFLYIYTAECLISLCRNVHHELKSNFVHMEFVFCVIGFCHSVTLLYCSVCLGNTACLYQTV